MSNPQHTLPVHTKIENYRIDKVLGVGGFGVTYKGYDLNLNCAVAIKEFFPGDIAIREPNSRNVIPKSKEYLELYAQGLKRFLDEARLLAQFKLATVVRVNQFVKANGTAYIIMDYEEGLPLSMYLRSCKVLTEDEILNIILPVLTGLRDIHAYEILHRDIKPPNIYLRKQGLPVLLDFGSAHQSMPGRPATNTVTPGYAPFEQYNTREKQGPWTDLYAVGATLYRCMTGQTPPNALDRFAGIRSEDADPHVPAQECAKGRYSDELLAATDWMLNLTIKDRPQCVDDVLDALSYFTESPSQRQPASVVADYAEAEWDPGTLQQIESALVKYIGPIAKMVIDDSKATTVDIKQLCHSLAEEVESGKDRDQFLVEVSTLMLSGSNSSLTSERSNASANPAINTPIWDEDTLRHAESELAKYIGPLAPTLVRKAADQSMNMDEFIELLSDDIPTESHRTEFRANVKNLMQQA